MPQPLDSHTRDEEEHLPHYPNQKRERRRKQQHQWQLCDHSTTHRHSPKPQRALSGQGRKCPIINPVPTHPPKPPDPAQVPLLYGPACCNSKKGNPALCQTQLKAQPELHRITPFHQQIPGSSAFFHWDGARASERAERRPPSPQTVTSGVTAAPSSHHSFGKRTGSTRGRRKIKGCVVRSAKKPPKEGRKKKVINFST